MAVAPPPITAAILAAGPGLKGPVFLQIATAIGLAVTAWVQIPGNVVLSGATIGTAGAGSANGKFFMPVAPLPGTFPANTLLGPVGLEVAAAVGLGVSTALNANAQFTGVSVGVGAGVVANKVTVANPYSLLPLISANFTAQGIVGPSSILVAKACAEGIALLVMAGGGVGAVAGPPTPFPGVGTSICKLI